MRKILSRCFRISLVICRSCVEIPVNTDHSFIFRNLLRPNQPPRKSGCRLAYQVRTREALSCPRTRCLKKRAKEHPDLAFKPFTGWIVEEFMDCALGKQSHVIHPPRPLLQLQSTPQRRQANVPSHRNIVRFDRSLVSSAHIIPIVSSHQPVQIARQEKDWRDPLDAATSLNPIP